MVVNWLRKPAIIAFIAYAIGLLVLLVPYRATMLTQISGGRLNGEISPYMDDVGEIQVALNLWGTVHHTGYPLFTMLGNGFTAIARTLGIDAATAPALYAMGWGLVGLTAIYWLLLRLTQRPMVAASAMVVLGLARSVWIHNVIAEVYSMSVAITAVLLVLAVVPFGSLSNRQRIWCLALVGGIGVAHHRLIALLAPGLILAVWPEWWGMWRKQRSHALMTVVVAAAISLVGFLPYVYLPLRALAGANWVYGQPATLAGFWHEFTGAEAAFLMQTPMTFASLLNDAQDTITILGVELTPLLALVAAGGCLAMILRPRFRRPMLIVLVSVAGPFFYLIVQHRVVMPQATALPIVIVLVIGLALTVATLMEAWSARRDLPLRSFARQGLTLLAVGTALAVTTLIAAHYPFVQALTTDPTGVATIQRARLVPREDGRAVLWLPWGPNYTAVAFSSLVTGENRDLTVVPHNQSEVRNLVASGRQLYTFSEVFYRFPLSWWDQQLGRTHLTALAPGVIGLRTTPILATTTTATPITAGIVLRTAGICTTPSNIHLLITWGASQPPDKDLSVYVHLTDSISPVPLAQSDASAPIEGWYPTSRWQANEVIYDSYALPRLANGERVIFGMYEQAADSSFINYGETILPVALAVPCQSGSS